MMYLLLGIHNHQPVGNFDHVLEKAFQSAYSPFVAVLERHPKIKVGMHFSGILYEWMENAHPDYLKRIAELVARGQIELLCGGFYEPVLSALPENDQKGQIAKMQKYLKSHFGAQAEGLWLTERVWEPQLPKMLAKTGVRYTIVDDAHFLAVGFSRKELQGYFLTESEGAELRVFPISQKLRYMIPFSPPEEVISFLKQAHHDMGQGGSGALVMADDGEKFGLWPQTYQTVYTEGWLERFFTEIEKNEDWLRTATFSEYLKLSRPRGWAYLPTMSYSELSEWALRPESSRELEHVLKGTPEQSRMFVRGGFFRNFLTKYPEASWLYRKMLRVSKKVHGINASDSAQRAQQKEEALNSLWKGQCNCAYWHGVFGGLYLPHLRGAIYSQLLAAEQITDELEADDKSADKNNKVGDLYSEPKSGVRFSVQQEDWDADGIPEVLIENPAANWYFAPGKGAGMWEWDLKKRKINLSSIVSRRPEAYHEKIKEAVRMNSGGAKSIHGTAVAKQPDLDKYLFYDWHQRMSLLDHFLHPDTQLGHFAAVHYGEQGDFVLGEYEQERPAIKDGKLMIGFAREGRVWSHNIPLKIRVQKEILLDPRGPWRCRYRIENKSAEVADVWFGSELVFSFSTPETCGELDEKQIRQKDFHDNAFGLDLKLETRSAMDLWAFPINTISQSEEGFEKTYQGSVLLLHQKLNLAPGAAAELEFSVSA